MADPRDELRDKVAIAIDTDICTGDQSSVAMELTSEEIKTLAAAAIAVVLEEAAKAIDQMPLGYPGNAASSSPCHRRSPMTDITIPPEAVEAAARAICTADLDLPYDTPDFHVYARAAIAAALAAWPGMEKLAPHDSAVFNDGAIILPLPQEKPND